MEYTIESFGDGFIETTYEGNKTKLINLTTATDAEINDFILKTMLMFVTGEYLRLALVGVPLPPEPIFVAIAQAKKDIANDPDTEANLDILAVAMLRAIAKFPGTYVVPVSLKR